MNNKAKVVKLVEDLKEELIVSMQEITENALRNPQLTTEEDHLNDCVANYDRIKIIEVVKHLDILRASLITSPENKRQAFRELAKKEFDGDITKLSKKTRMMTLESVLKDLSDRIF